MRVAAIDLGSVRVGLAVSDDLGLLAHPRAVLSGTNLDRLTEQLLQLARSEAWERLVVGLPRHLDGREGAGARKARSIAERLRRALELPVELADERWTTQEALRRLRDGGTRAREARTRVDSAAAAVILQSWLDAQRPETPR